MVALACLPNQPLQQTPAAFVVSDPKLPGRRGLLSGVVSHHRGGSTHEQVSLLQFHQLWTDRNLL